MGVKDIVLALFLAWVGRELWEWSDYAARALVRLSCRLLPVMYKERLEEEWLAALGEIPGRLGRVIFAFGLPLAAARICAPDGIPLTRRLEVRSFDVLWATYTIGTVAPLIVLIAFVLRISQPGPVFRPMFVVGRNGKIVTLLHLSCYYVNSEGRIVRTRFQRAVRALKINQVPSILAVFRGDLALFGPAAPRVFPAAELLALPVEDRWTEQTLARASQCAGLNSDNQWVHCRAMPPALSGWDQHSGLARDIWARILGVGPTCDLDAAFEEAIRDNGLAVYGKAVWTYIVWIAMGRIK